MLYKYFPVGRSGFLSDQLIRFTQPGDFNDPFELHPSFDLMSKADLAALPVAPECEGGDGRMRTLTPAALQAMLSAVMPGLRKETSRHAGHDGAFALDNNRIAQSTFDAKFGVLCLSEVPDSLPMWAHYAGNHRGFVVQFDEAHPFFSAEEFDGQSLGITRVEYSVDRPVLSFSTLYSPQLYYRKSPVWSYEREWRLVRPLSAAAHTVAHHEFPRHLFQVPREAVKGVILGFAMPHETRVLLMENIGKALSHATIFQTVLARDTYDLEIHPPLDGVVPTGALAGRVFEAR